MGKLVLIVEHDQGARRELRRKLEIDPAILIPNPAKSLGKGALGARPGGEIVVRARHRPTDPDLAAGRVDAVCSLKPARSVDIAAASVGQSQCPCAIRVGHARKRRRIRPRQQAQFNRVDAEMQSRRAHQPDVRRRHAELAPQPPVAAAIAHFRANIAPPA